MSRRTSRPWPPDVVLSAIFLGGFAAAWWPTALAIYGPHPVRWIPLVAHVCGMTAGYGVLVLVGLMSRAPGLERGVGADVLARWHGRGGRIVIGLVLAHAVAAVVGWADARREGRWLALWHVVGLPWLMWTTLGTILLVAVGLTSARAARARLSYESWHTVHLLTYVGVALSFAHQLAGPDMSGHRVLQVLWALLYVHVFALLLRHRVIAPLRQAGRHRMQVVAVFREGPDVVSIDVAGQHLSELAAETGQFFRWRFLTPELWRTAHPFSLSAPPTDTRLRLTVKALGQGSARLQHVPVGTWVVTEGPYGAMTSARRTREDVLLIAGGVGITPMRALFETMPLAPGQDLTLLYRARGPEHVLFHDELEYIARRRGTRVHYLLGDDPDCFSAASLVRLVPRLAERDVFMCGPAGMSDAVRAALAEVGVPKERIHEERFAF